MDKLDLKCLSFKTLMLMALASARRCSSLAMLSIKDGYCVMSENRMTFQPIGLEKESRLDHIAPPIVVEAFDDANLDPVSCVSTYLERAKDIRKSSNLFVTLNQPHKAAGKTTLSAWIVKVIKQSGQNGSGGSVRSAASSKAVSSGAPLETVLAAGDWARESTFKRFYYKPGPLSFSDAVLR